MPANVLVFQDGQRATNPKGSLRVPQVMENLIAQKKMPVTIGIFITPGNLSETIRTDLGMGTRTTGPRNTTRSTTPTRAS